MICSSHNPYPVYDRRGDKLYSVCNECKNIIHKDKEIIEDFELLKKQIGKYLVGCDQGSEFVSLIFSEDLERAHNANKIIIPYKK